MPLWNDTNDHYCVIPRCQILFSNSLTCTIVTTTLWIVAVITPILQVRKLRFREVKLLSQCHTRGSGFEPRLPGCRGYAIHCYTTQPLCKIAMVSFLPELEKKRVWWLQWDFFNLPEWFEIIKGRNWEFTFTLFLIFCYALDNPKIPEFIEFG